MCEIADFSRRDDYNRAIVDCDRDDRVRTRGLPSPRNADKAKGDHDRAITDYDRVIALLPAAGYGWRGRAYEVTGDYERALADFDHALQLSPSDQDLQEGRDSVLAKRSGP